MTKMQIEQRLNPKLENKENVMACTLHLLTITWFLSALSSYWILLSPTYHDMFSTQSWIPFLFIGVTIIWVVLSRVISPLVRFVLFLLWICSLLFLVSWATTNNHVGNAITYGVISMTLIFLTLSIITNHIGFDNMKKNFFIYIVLSLVIVSALYMILPDLSVHININERNIDTFLYIGITVVILVIFQIWHTLSYLNYNPHLLQIHNTCVFALMAPWTETIDTFSSLSRFN